MKIGLGKANRYAQTNEEWDDHYLMRHHESEQFIESKDGRKKSGKYQTKSFS